MESSILDDIKIMLGVNPEDTTFDTDIKIHISSAIMDLWSLGVGPDGFIVNDRSQKWSDITPDPRFAAIKTYVYLKTKAVFDPETNAALIEAWLRTTDRIEWQLRRIKEEILPEV